MLPACYSAKGIQMSSVMLDHEWGKEAFKRFPDLLDSFDHVDSPYALWIELRMEFHEAYKAPRNEDLIARIYDFARWCCSQPPGKTAEDDLGTCVCVCFYEDIPESPEAIEDMPRWFSRSEVLLMKEVFSYHAGKEGLHRILVACERYEKQQRKTGRRRGRKLKS